MLMGALYMAISVQLRHTQLGREVVEQSTLARSLLARIDTDIRQSLGPPMPASTSSGSSGSGGASPTMGGGSTGSTATTPSGTSSTTTVGNNTTDPTSGATSSAGTTTTGGTGAVQFNLFVQGDANSIMLYVSRVPRELNPIPSSDNADQPLVSDLRRVSYWLAGGGDNPLGLARQEVTMVTSDEAMANVPPGIPDEGSLVIADEVKSLTFSYWDGSNWQDSWDGTVAGPDGSTPVGPPLAIAITMGLAIPSAESATGGERQLKLYRHVVPIVTANGISQPATSGTTTP
jgi:hypothetical protein